MATHHTTCALCEALCGIVVNTGDDGTSVTSIVGDKNDPLSKGHICPKAVALQDLHNDPDRVRTPLRREGDTFVPVGWDEALDDIADRICALQKAYGPSTVGSYVGNPVVHDYATVLTVPPFRRALGGRSRFSASSVDQLPHMLCAWAQFGHGLALPVPDIDRTQLFVVLGANPLASNGSLMTAPGVRKRIKDLQARGGRMVVLDPRRSETADLADEHVFVRPGTDALLLAAMLHTVFADDLVADGPWTTWSKGAGAVRDAVSQFDADAVAPVTGVPAETIRRLARELAATERAVVYGRMGTSVQAFGALCAWLITCLNTVTGHLDSVGGAMWTTPAADLMALTAKAGLDGGFARFRSRVRGLPEFGGELPSATLAEEILEPGEGQIRGMVVVGGNPLVSVPGGRRLEEAFDGLELLVCVDPWLSATARRAHYVLPPSSHLERDHYGLVFHALAVRNTTKYSPPVFEPGPDVWHDWRIMAELGKRLLARRGGKWGVRSQLIALTTFGPELLLDLALRAGPSRPRASLKSLLKTPSGRDLGPLQPRLPGLLRTQDKLVDLAPPLMVADVERLAATLSGAASGVGQGTGDGDGDGAGNGDGDGAGNEARRDLLLISRRQLRSNNSWMHNVPRLMRGPNRCTLQMHPEDAGARSLDDGQEVQLASRAGDVIVQLEVTDVMMPGVVCLPHGWGHGAKGARLSVASAAEGASVNDVVDPALVDQLSGNAALSGVPVSVQTAAR